MCDAISTCQLRATDAASGSMFRSAAVACFRFQAWQGQCDVIRRKQPAERGWRIDHGQGHSTRMPRSWAPSLLAQPRPPHRFARVKLLIRLLRFLIPKAGILDVERPFAFALGIGGLCTATTPALTLRKMARGPRGDFGQLERQKLVLLSFSRLVSWLLSEISILLNKRSMRQMQHHTPDTAKSRWSDV